MDAATSGGANTTERAVLGIAQPLAVRDLRDVLLHALGELGLEQREVGRDVVRGAASRANHDGMSWSSHAVITSVRQRIDGHSARASKARLAIDGEIHEPTFQPLRDGCELFFLPKIEAG